MLCQEELRRRASLNKPPAWQRTTAAAGWSGCRRAAAGAAAVRRDARRAPGGGEPTTDILTAAVGGGDHPANITLTATLLYWRASPIQHLALAVSSPQYTTRRKCQQGTAVGSRIASATYQSRACSSRVGDPCRYVRTNLYEWYGEVR